MKSCFLTTCAIMMVALCVGGRVYAQGEPDCPCSQCVCITDVSCTNEVNCANQTGCEVTTFVAQCSQSYTMDVKLLCGSQYCESCLACAYLYDNSGNWLATLQAGCVANQCYASTTVTLTQGTMYKLYSCFRSCGNCSNCTTCSAKARIYCGVENCAAPCD